MRILVTGRDGQVARSLAERAPDHVELVFAARPQFDLEDEGSIARVVAEVRPDLVVSAAAYTAVDRAEDEAERAMAVNGVAPGALARAAAQAGARMLHLSTDYVFAGDKAGAYVEADPVGPIGVYGRSKLAGEKAVRAAGGDHLIMRTSWVYSPFGTNFVRTMLRLSAERDQVSVVEDQWGCPTSALDIADAVYAAADAWQGGIFHFAGTGDTNWAEFARAIFAASKSAGGPAAQVRAIPSSAYPTRAVRPANSRLDSGRFAAAFGYVAPHWRTSVAGVVERLVG